MVSPGEDEKNLPFWGPKKGRDRKQGTRKEGTNDHPPKREGQNKKQQRQKSPQPKIIRVGWGFLLLFICYYCLVLFYLWLLLLLIYLSCFSFSFLLSLALSLSLSLFLSFYLSAWFSRTAWYQTHFWWFLKAWYLTRTQKYLPPPLPTSSCTITRLQRSGSPTRPVQLHRWFMLLTQLRQQSRQDLSGPLRIAASIAFLFCVCLKGFLTL